MGWNFNDPKNAHTAQRTRIAGWFIASLAAVAAVLPLLQPAHAAGTISALLLLAGAAEFAAGATRHQTRKLAMLAGVATVVAGLIFLTDAAVQFLPSVIVITGWLLLRSLILAVACGLEGGSVRVWTGLSAATDLLLALSLGIGLSVSTLIVSLFGATPELIASFAWVLALSFVVTAVLLIQVARCALTNDV